MSNSYWTEQKEAWRTELPPVLYTADFMAQSVKVSANLNREDLYELGRKAPYHRYINFPVEVTCEIKTLASTPSTPKG